MLLWRVGELSNPPAQEGNADSSANNHRDNWVCWQSSSHVQQSSQKCNNPLTLEFLMFYSNQPKQTWLSSLSGTGNSLQSPGPATVNCEPFPCTNTITLATTHNRRFSPHLPRIFCSKLIKRVLRKLRLKISKLEQQTLARQCNYSLGLSVRIVLKMSRIWWSSPRVYLWGCYLKGIAEGDNPPPWVWLVPSYDMGSQTEHKRTKKKASEAPTLCSSSFWLDRLWASYAHSTADNSSWCNVSPSGSTMSSLINEQVESLPPRVARGLPTLPVASCQACGGITHFFLPASQCIHPPLSPQSVLSDQPSLFCLNHSCIWANQPRAWVLL